MSLSLICLAKEAQLYTQLNSPATSQLWTLPGEKEWAMDSEQSEVFNFSSTHGKLRNLILNFLISDKNHLVILLQGLEKCTNWVAYETDVSFSF